MTARAAPPDVENARLPQALRELGSVVGGGEMLKLVERFGGSTVFVSAAEGSALVATVGQAAATAMVGHYGPGVLYVPLARRWRALIYAGRGMTRVAIARAIGCTERRVYAWLSGDDQDGDKADQQGVLL